MAHRRRNVQTHNRGRGPRWTLAAAFIVALYVPACSSGREHERATSEHSAAPVTLSVPEPDTSPTQPVSPDLPPVEFELVIGRDRFDVGQGPIVLANGSRVEVTTKPFWTFSTKAPHGGPHMSLTHAPTVRATVIPTGGIKLGTLDAVAEIAVVLSERDEEEALQSLVAGLSAGTTVVSSEANVYRVFGRERAGTRLQTVGPTVDLVVAAAGPHRQLRVFVTSSTTDADLKPLRAAIETLTLEKRAPTPQFTVTVRDRSGSIVGSADTSLGDPVEIGGSTMTVARRATVREQLRTMRFEHSADLTARYSTGEYPAVGMYYGSISIHVVLLPRRFAHSELVVKLGVPIGHGQLVSRTIDGVEYWATEGTFSAGDVTLRSQLFSFEREGRHFAVGINAPPSDVEKANELANTVMSSLR